tara:strand:- start:76 stop:378 length:303 start_codon:yes stop_codon:yes gene_type:complete
MINDPETNPCETIDIDTLREYMHQHLQDTVEKELRNSSQSDTLDNLLENYICSCSDQEVKDYLTEYDHIGDILRSNAEDDYEPTDQEMMSSFGTKWHDYL